MMRRRPRAESTRPRDLMALNQAIPSIAGDFTRRTHQWLVKAPTGGLPGMVDDTPGKADCEVWWINTDDDTTDPAEAGADGETQTKTVYNLGDSEVAEGQFVAAITITDECLLAIAATGSAPAKEPKIFKTPLQGILGRRDDGTITPENCEEYEWGGNGVVPVDPSNSEPVYNPFTQHLPGEAFLIAAEIKGRWTYIEADCGCPETDQEGPVNPPYP